MDNFKLQIMASDHMVYDGDAKSVSLSTTEGSIGVMAHHMNLIMAIVPGMLSYIPAGESGAGEKVEVIVSDGLLKVENGEVMILVDSAEYPEDIDEARAKRAEDEAREKLRRANSSREMAMISAELSRAMSRIKASKNKHKL
jgi:F-type H+-transporting ATPase subunit epsilon